MENKVKIMPQTQIILDATMLDTFIMCPEKYRLRFMLNRVPPDVAKPLDRGTMIHHGLEAYYKSLQKISDWDKAMQAMIEALDIAATESQLDIESISHIKDCVIQSCNVHQAADMKFEILAVEEPFAYVLYEDDLIRIIMIGKIDLLVNDGFYERLPIDHKSYERDYPVHRKTNQFMNYVTACNSNFLLVNRVGMQTSIAPIKKHKRIPLSYDPIFLGQWKDNVIRWCHFYLECVATNSFPLNDTSCDKFNRLCEYYQICDSSGMEAKTFKLEMHYAIAPKWDVSKPLSEGDR